MNQLSKLPHLIGTIARDEKKNLIITPYELIEGNQYKGDSWKKIHNVAIPFGTNEGLLHVLAVGDEVEYMLIMGEEGPLATNITRCVMVNPSTKQSHNPTLDMEPNKGLCPLRDTLIETYRINAYIEID